MEPSRVAISVACLTIDCFKIHGIGIPQKEAKENWVAIILEEVVMARKISPNFKGHGIWQIQEAEQILTGSLQMTPHQGTSYSSCWKPKRGGNICQHQRTVVQMDSCFYIRTAEAWIQWDSILEVLKEGEKAQPRILYSG